MCWGGKEEVVHAGVAGKEEGKETMADTSSAPIYKIRSRDTVRG